MPKRDKKFDVLSEVKCIHSYKNTRVFPARFPTTNSLRRRPEVSGKGKHACFIRMNTKTSRDKIEVNQMEKIKTKFP